MTAVFAWRFCSVLLKAQRLLSLPGILTLSLCEARTNWRTFLAQAAARCSRAGFSEGFCTPFARLVSALHAGEEAEGQAETWCKAHAKAAASPTEVRCRMNGRKTLTVRSRAPSMTLLLAAAT